MRQTEECSLIVHSELVTAARTLASLNVSHSIWRRDHFILR